MDELRVGEPERARSTPQLLRHALDEARLLARAEVAVARAELKAELRRGMRAGIALGAAFVVGVCALSVLFVAIALALPMAAWGAAVLVGALLLVAAAAVGAVGAKRLPRKPMQRTKERLMEDLTMARERLQ